MPQLSLMLTERNARHLRQPMPEVAYALLERTLYDPPRAAAAARWASQLQRSFPQAELAPYVWHYISHDRDDGLRDHASRTMPGEPHELGALRDTPQARQAWTAVLPCIEALHAKRIVLRTAASISPGNVGRRRIETFVKARRDDGLATVWEPEGLWDQDEATAFARDIGATLLWRAFVAGRPARAGQTLADPAVWLRVDGAGRNPRMSPDQLDALLEHTDEQPDSVLVFTGPKALGNLRAFAAES
jgi:hypothetical protein